MSKFAFLFFFLFAENIRAAQEKGGMPQLNPDSYPSQIFWLVLLFSILLILNHFLFLPKIQNIRDKRSKTIENYLKEAKQINDSMHSLIEEIKKDFDKAKNDQNNILNATFEENKKIFDNKVSEINEEFEIKKKKFENSIEANKSSILLNLPSMCVTLSDLLYEKIMSEKNKGSIKEFKQFFGDN